MSSIAICLSALSPAADPAAEGWRVEGEVPEGFDVYSPACVLDNKIFFHGNSGLLSFDPLSGVSGGSWDLALPQPPVIVEAAKQVCYVD